MQNLLRFLLKYNYWLLFFLLEVISFVLLFRFNSYQGSVFLTSANSLSGMICEEVSDITSYFGLRSVNKALVARNTELELLVEQMKKELAHYTADTTSIARLQEDVLRDYQCYPADVVNNSITRLNNYITINKGEKDGIRPEMGVIDGNGVVGIVYQTSSHYSLILSVLNAKSSISCKIKRTEYLGALKWEGGSSQYALVKDMPRHSEFSLGDTIVTSGHSAVFPEGIPIGVVDDMKDSHDGLTYWLRVKLFTNFARLNSVQVIASTGREELSELERSVEKN